MIENESEWTSEVLKWILDREQFIRPMGSYTMTFERITHNPKVMGGKPCIRGMRITVGTLVGLIAVGTTRERILEAYPHLEPADLDAALTYAAWRLEEREEDLVLT